MIEDAQAIDALQVGDYADDELYFWGLQRSKKVIAAASQNLHHKVPETAMERLFEAHELEQRLVGKAKRSAGAS